METRICSRCCKEKPIEDFHKNSCSKGGRLAYCKKCKIRKKKTCKTCGKTKELKCFHKNPDMLDGRVNQCKSCKRDQDKARYERLKSLPDNNILLQGWTR